MAFPAFDDRRWKIDSVLIVSRCTWAHFAARAWSEKQKTKKSKSNRSILNRFRDRTGANMHVLACRRCLTGRQIYLGIHRFVIHLEYSWNPTSNCAGLSHIFATIFIDFHSSLCVTKFPISICGLHKKNIPEICYVCVCHIAYRPRHSGLRPKHAANTHRSTLHSPILHVSHSLV